jgi:hypothetical protein
MAQGGYKPMASPSASFNPQITPNSTQPTGGLQQALMQANRGVGTLGQMPMATHQMLPTMVPGAGTMQQGANVPPPPPVGQPMQPQGFNQGFAGGLGQGMNNPFARQLVR